MKGDTRCIEGRLWRHDPQPDDPELETDVGQCPECEGRGCVRCEDCGEIVGTVNEADQCEDCYQIWFEEQRAYWEPLYRAEKRAGLLDHG